MFYIVGTVGCGAFFTWIFQKLLAQESVLQVIVRDLSAIRRHLGIAPADESL